METMENYAFFGGNSMEIQYHSHLTDSEMVSPEESISAQYDYDHVMMAFTHQEQLHPQDNLLEIEMLDQEEINHSPSQRPLSSTHSSPPANPIECILPHSPSHPSLSPNHNSIDSNHPSTSCLLPPPQSHPPTPSVAAAPSIHSSPVDPHNLEPSAEFQSHPTSVPSTIPSPGNSTHQSILHSPHDKDVYDPPTQSLQPPSPTPAEPLLESGLKSDSLSFSTLPQATCNQSVEPPTTAQPSPPRSTRASSSEASVAAPRSPSAIIAPSQPPQIVQAHYDVDQNAASSLDHDSTLLEDSVALVDSELNHHSEEVLDCQEQWDNNPLGDEIPYDYYESDSRPKVRTELLDHVRLEFESTGLNDPDLPFESDLTPAPGVRLVCEGCEYSLFQRIERHSNSDSAPSAQASIDDETVLLSEPECRELYYGPLEAFIQSLHNIFPNLHNNNKNEIVLNFPALEIKVPEDNIYSKEISLYDVDRLHIGARLPDRLLMSLEKQPRLVHRFNVLATYVFELGENNATTDGNPGGVSTEEGSDVSVEHLIVDNKDDTDRPHVSEELRVSAGSPAHLASTASIAVNKPDVLSSMMEQLQSTNAPNVVPSPRKQETSDLCRLDSLSHSSALTPTIAVNLATATDDLAVIDESSAIQETESPQLSNTANNSTDKLSHRPDGQSLETFAEVVYEYSHPDPAVESNPVVVVQLEGVDSSQAPTQDNVPIGAESCSNSERTITGLDLLSEGEIEELVEQEPKVPSDMNASLADEPVSDVITADHDQQPSALLATVSNDDCVPNHLLLTGPLPSHVSSKRHHTEIEGTAESLESAHDAARTHLESSDIKKARLL